MTAGVLLRYHGGEVYGLLNTVPGALLSVRVAGVDIIPPLHGPHAVIADDDGALLTSATLTQLVEATPHARRIALGMSAAGEPAPVSRLLRTARRVGAEWPYAATKPTGISEVTHLVDTLGVRGAARELGVSPSAVSRRMKRAGG